jgi:hypothetical protein
MRLGYGHPDIDFSNYVVRLFVPACSGFQAHLTRQHRRAYLIFMATNFSFIPIVYFFYPETNNLTLEEVDFLFLDKRDPRMVEEVLRRRKRAESVGATASGDSAETVESSLASGNGMKEVHREDMEA